MKQSTSTVHGWIGGLLWGFFLSAGESSLGEWLVLFVKTNGSQEHRLWMHTLSYHNNRERTANTMAQLAPERL